MWQVFAFTVLIEPLVVALFYRRRWYVMAPVAFVATALTHLTMHRVLPAYIQDLHTMILVGEVGALLFEALAFYIFDSEHRIGLAMMASAAANTASFLLGIAILPIF